MPSRFIPVSGGVTPVSNPSNGSQSSASIFGSKIYPWASPEEETQYNQWANLYTDQDTENQLNNYYDYYFSGQDIQIYIEGLTDPKDVLPIYQFAYNVQQKKQPIFGYASYTYDYMMTGTRIVSGAFTIFPPRPDYMTMIVSKAAEVRANQSNYSKSLNPIRGLDTDDANIQKYWRRNYDSNLTGQQKHLFSSHPPFNFQIIYGIQDVSIGGADAPDRVEQLRSLYKQSTAMMSDINERLVESDQVNNSRRILIENVQLVSRDTQYTPDGDPITETYSFTGRDIREAPMYGGSGGGTKATVS